MSQKNPSDGGQKGFAVGRGLLAAAETLNFSMNKQRSGPQNRPLGAMVTGGLGVAGGEGQDRSSQLPRRGGGGGGSLGSTMKLFASLGLSPADLDALAQIPEENISVETLPRILMELKSRKGGDRRMGSSSRDLTSMSSEGSYRGGWDDMGSVDPSMGQSSFRAPPADGFGFSSMQDAPSARGYDLDYGSSSGGTGGREGQYSELSRHGSYDGLGMGPSSSNSILMQRRIGSPSQGKIQDFLGAPPPMFPHVCSLCDFDVHSSMEWNQHTNGLRHAENRRLLLKMYPDWDPGMPQRRSMDPSMETPNLSAGLLGPAPMASGLPSSWGGDGPGFSGKNHPHPGQHKMRGRVVVAKYLKKPFSNRSLFVLALPFGKIREHVVLNNKAFLEMDTHQQAVDMVNYYQNKPALMHGKPVTFYLSKELLVIEKGEQGGDRPREMKSRSQVVFFSNLPKEDDKKTELLTVAGRFGTVEKHLFLTDEAFVQLGSPEDAQMLVKYYTINPLTIRGRHIRLNICHKYKTLNVNRRGGQERPGEVRGRRGSSGNRTSSKTTSTKSSASKNRAGKRKEEKKPSEEKVESGEEVAGVMEGDGGEEEKEKEEGVEAEDEDKDKEEEDEEEEEEEERDQPMETDEEMAAVEPSVEPDQLDPEQPTQDAPLDGAPETDGGAPEGEAPDGEETEAQGQAEGPKMEKEGSGEDVEATGEAPKVETVGSGDKPEPQDELLAEAGENPEMTEGDLPEDMEGLDQDFLENMDEFVTLDELDEEEDDSHTKKTPTIDNSRKGGMRVVNIDGFRRGQGFLNELLALAKPFGTVVKHLVLDLRPEAFLQFETEDQARAMVRFYSGNVSATVCGRLVRINHSMNYPTIQCGGSRVVYIGQIPISDISDEDILKLAEPFGQVKKYFLNRIKRECFIEMEKAEDAEKMADSCKLNPPKIQGRRLMVYVSRKYKQLKYGHRLPILQADKKTGKRDSSMSSQSSSKHSQEPPAKKMKKKAGEEEQGDKEEVSREEQDGAGAPETEPDGDTQPAGTSEGQSTTDVVKREEEEVEVSTQKESSVGGGEVGQAAASQAPAEAKVAPASLPLVPYDPNTPIGVEYVKMGYYCRVCLLFYSNEDMAKKTHCSSQTHYDKLKKYLEKEKTPGNKKVKPVPV